MVSMAVAGLMGQTWGAFIVSELMTGRFKSSKAYLWAAIRLLEPTGSSGKVSGIMARLVWKITGSLLSMGQTGSSKLDFALTETRSADSSKLDSTSTLVQTDCSKLGASTETGLVDISVSKTTLADNSQSD